MTTVCGGQLPVVRGQDKIKKLDVEVGMKGRVVCLGIGLLLLLLSMSLSACIDKSKWRAKDHGGPPNWEEDFGRPDYDW